MNLSKLEQAISSYLL